MKCRHLRLLTTTVVAGAMVLMISGMTSRTTVQPLSFAESEAFGGTACVIGNCTGDQRRSDCDPSKDTEFCSSFTTYETCCYAIRSRSTVHECFGDGGADCWSYGESTCFIGNWCTWESEKCKATSCFIEKADEQQCI